ncbi:MAG TPA: hypothetical protein VH309_07655 [Elusimicrobiota bacterium]|jgi:hypothetical protein|nr:hypothetical protein [Elusimicrobiota bacterium]
MRPEHAAAEGLALFALCWLLARVEIEIEGDKGWAASLPTWRWGPDWWLDLTNGKEVTGYHLWLTLFLVAVFHLPLVFAGFSRALWSKCVSSYLLTTAVWDLQWFAWNPAWGLARFRAAPIPWFRRKLLGFPVDYYAAVAASGASAFLIWRPGLGAWAVRTAAALAASAASVAAAEMRGFRRASPPEAPARPASR